MDPPRHPDIHTRRFILQAAGRDPRYLLLLPILFTVPEGGSVATIAETFYSLLDAESMYPAGLRRFFNPCIQLDPSGITPFLPYIIRGDLNRLLCDDTDLPPTSLDREGESGSPNDTGASEDAPDIIGGPATKENSHPYASAPTSSVTNGDGSLSDDDHVEIYWDFNTVTLSSILTTLLTIVIAAIVVISTIPALYCPYLRKAVVQTHPEGNGEDNGTHAGGQRRDLSAAPLWQRVVPEVSQGAQVALSQIGSERIKEGDASSKTYPVTGGLGRR